MAAALAEKDASAAAADSARQAKRAKFEADQAAKQAELLKHAYERAVGNLRELGDLISKSNGEAIEVLNQRFAESMDEVKALADQK